MENIILESSQKRKGPVFIEIPIDVQAKNINYDKMFNINYSLIFASNLKFLNILSSIIILSNNIIG